MGVGAGRCGGTNYLTETSVVFLIFITLLLLISSSCHRADAARRRPAVFDQREKSYAVKQERSTTGDSTTTFGDIKNSGPSPGGKGHSAPSNRY